MALLTSIMLLILMINRNWQSSAKTIEKANF